MPRKKKPPEHENHERWLISYADFITLLFAFFVVMYSISSVNEGKYRVLSDTLTNVFDNVPKSSEALKTDAESGKIGKPTTIETQKVSADSLIDMPFTIAENQKKHKLEAMAGMVEDTMKGLINEELIKVTRNKKWLEIEIKSSLLYLSGSAEVEPEAFPVIDSIAAMLKDQPNYIQVEGFTDNQRIRSPIYPSNWELSAARAASIVHLFMEEGVAPHRMAAIGYGEHRPIADNATRKGRAANRRVVLIVLADGKPEHAVDTQRESEIQ